MAWRYSFAFILLVAGIVFNYLGIGSDFLGFESVGSWMIYVGFVIFAIISIQFISKKERIVDERMERRR